RPPSVDDRGRQGATSHAPCDDDGDRSWASPCWSRCSRATNGSRSGPPAAPCRGSPSPDFAVSASLPPVAVARYTKGRSAAKRIVLRQRVLWSWANAAIRRAARRRRGAARATHSTLQSASLARLGGPHGGLPPPHAIRGCRGPSPAASSTRRPQGGDLYGTLIAPVRLVFQRCPPEVHAAGFGPIDHFELVIGGDRLGSLGHPGGGMPCRRASMGGRSSRALWPRSSPPSAACSRPPDASTLQGRQAVLRARPSASP